jgi:hypothetical protein
MKVKNISVCSNYDVGCDVHCIWVKTWYNMSFMVTFLPWKSTQKVCLDIFVKEDENGNKMFSLTLIF